jgi:hypothetical protein
MSKFTSIKGYCRGGLSKTRFGKQDFLRAVLVYGRLGSVIRETCGMA